MLGNKLASGSWTVLKFFSLYYTFKTFVFRHDWVILSGKSMEPTFAPNDIVLVETYSVNTRRLKK
jgi:signal peptidase I